MPTIHITAEAVRAINRNVRPGHVLATSGVIHLDGSASIQVDSEVLVRLESLRGPNESLSSVILQLCGGTSTNVN